MPRNKKSHYEVLGVDKGAKPEEVKKAYRRKAERAHPDKGGSDEEMAEVNQAYEVLSNPERRQLYDSTGADRARPFDEEVRNVVLGAFADGLNKDAPDCLAHARDLIEKQRRQIEAARREAVNAQKKYAARREKISTKGDVNLFHLIIDRQLEQIAQSIGAMDREEEKFKAALELLKGYESKERLPVREMQYRMILSQDFGGATSGWPFKG